MQSLQNQFVTAVAVESVHIIAPYEDYNRGGETAALRPVTCDSLSFAKNYMFVFLFSIAKGRKIVKWYCGS